QTGQCRASVLIISALGLQGNAGGAGRIAARTAGSFDLKNEFEKPDGKFVRAGRLPAAAIAFCQSNFWTKPSGVFRMGKTIYVVVVVHPQDRRRLLPGVGACAARGR